MAGGIAAGMMPALSRALTPSGKSLKLTIGEPTQVIDDAANVGSQSIKSVGAAAKGFSKIPKGFKEVKDFGYQHGEKVYKYSVVFP